MKQDHILKGAFLQARLRMRSSVKQRLISRNRKKNTVLAYLFLMPSLAGVLLFVLLPFLDVVRRSFFEAVGGSAVGLANYRLVLQSGAFCMALANTVRFLSVCMPLLLILSLSLALLLQERNTASERFRTLFLAPLAVPVASIVFLWRLFFDKAGYLNQMTGWLQAPPIDWMNGGTAFYVLVFSYLWKNTGCDMILWLAGLNGISPSLYEAARVDGAGSRQCFFFITLPCLKYTAGVITVMSFINSFKVFREAYLVAGDYPHESIYMLQHLFNNWFVQLDVHKLSAAAVMVSLVIVLTMWLAQRIIFRKREETAREKNHCLSCIVRSFHRNMDAASDGGRQFTDGTFRDL